MVVEDKEEENGAERRKCMKWWQVKRENVDGSQNKKKN